MTSERKVKLLVSEPKVKTFVSETTEEEESLETVYITPDGQF